MTTSPPEPPARETDLGMPPNVAGTLCYLPCCIGLVFSIVAAVVEKRSAFVRFHAFHSLLFHAAMLVLFIGLQIVHLAIVAMSGMLGLVFSLGIALVSLVCLGLEVYLMIKAYGNEEFQLPVIGEMAKKWV